MLERVAKSKVSGMGMGAMVAPAGVSWWRSSMLCASCWDVWIFVQNGRRSPLCVIVASIGFFTSSPLPPLPRPLPPPPPRPPPQGLDYAEWFEALKHKNQVHVEVY
jgi:hypothetical protein